MRVHPQEGLLEAARVFQGTPAGRERLQERVAVEHGLARLGHLGIGQARYVGRRKTRFQLLLAATVANLRWTWNWAAAQALSPGHTPAEGPEVAAQRAAPRLSWSGLRWWWQQVVHWNCTRVAVRAR